MSWANGKHIKDKNAIYSNDPNRTVWVCVMCTVLQQMPIFNHRNLVKVLSHLRFTDTLTNYCWEIKYILFRFLLKAQIPISFRRGPKTSKSVEHLKHNLMARRRRRRGGGGGGGEINFLYMQIKFSKTVRPASPDNQQPQQQSIEVVEFLLLYSSY